MNPTDDVMILKLKEMHPAWGIEIEPPPKGPRRGAVRQEEGSGFLRYAYGENERGRFLEFYSFHRIWGDSHARIYDTGEVEALGTLQTMRLLTGDPDEDKRSLEQQNQRNKELLVQLDEAGLLSGGPVPTSFQINAAIATGAVDPEDERPPT